MVDSVNMLITVSIVGFSIILLVAGMMYIVTVDPFGYVAENKICDNLERKLFITDDLNATEKTYLWDKCNYRDE